MANKFNRNFKLTIQSNAEKAAYFDASLLDSNSNTRLLPADKNIVNNQPTYQAGRTAMVIEPPFTIEVDINRIVGAGENTAIIKIYGLNAKSRAQLFKDVFNVTTVKEGSYFRRVILEGGYGQNLYPIFIGSLTQGYSLREGADEITYLHCVSGAVGLYNTFINQSYTSEVTQGQVLNDVVQELIKSKDISVGTITTLDERFSGGVIVQGDAFNVMSQFGVDVFIDLGKINALKLDEILGKIAGNITKISSDTGLVGTPIRSGAYVVVNTIFEPSIKLATLVELESVTANYFNGTYKVMGISHKGIFSRTKDGKLITTLKLWIGDKIVNGWKEVA